MTFDFVRVRSAAWLAALWAVLGLPGCGPGIGGTGTGSPVVDLAGFEAQAQSVCASEFAALLNCASSPTPGTATGPSAPTSLPGSQRVILADRATGRDVVLIIDGNGAQLQARCARVGFSGTWGVDAARNLRFYGLATLPTGSLALAQLAVEPRTGSSEASGLQLRLLARDGSALLTPVLVGVLASEPPPPDRCP